jgi:hypothetical protein
MKKYTTSQMVTRKNESRVIDPAASPYENFGGPQSGSYPQADVNTVNVISLQHASFYTPYK